MSDHESSILASTRMLIYSIPLDSLAATIENAPHAILIAEDQQLVLANAAALELFKAKDLWDVCDRGGRLFHSDEDGTPLNELLGRWSE